MKGRKLKRIDEGDDPRWLSGVCGGLAYYMGWPTWVIRVAWFLFISAGGTGLGAYILLWIFMPTWDELPKDFNDVTGD